MSEANGMAHVIRIHVLLLKRLDGIRKLINQNKVSEANIVYFYATRTHASFERISGDQHNKGR